MGIGYKRKKKMVGSKSYIKKKSLTRSVATTTRKRYKRLGSTEAKQIPPSKHKFIRQAIFYQFVHVLDAPSEKQWKGRGGTITLIRRALHLDFDQHRLIFFTLQATMRCIRAGKRFDGTINSNANAGRKLMIKPGSAEEILIATWMEMHCGFRMTTIMVNEHRREKGKDRVSRFAVMSAFYRLQPRITPIKKVQSGGNNPGWIDASYNICKQMQIMLGKLTDDEIMTDKEGNDEQKQITKKIWELTVIHQLTSSHQLLLICTFATGKRHFGPIPLWFDRKHLPKLDDTQIAFWDECHIEQQGGKVGNRKYQYTFKRDENGNLSDTGTYAEPTITKTSFKFPEQARFSFGVAKIKRNKANDPEGVRLNAINYTGKNITTIEVFEKKMKEEMNRVKKLTGNTSGWIKDTRPDGTYWGCDPISMLNGAGGKKGKTLVLAGITTVNDLTAKTDAELKELKKKTPGISLNKLTEWRNIDACDGVCPFGIQDYRKSPNPYLARYNDDLWREKIEASVYMQKFMCVTTLVSMIYQTSKRAFVGTTHEKTWFFYHDALKQMTAKSTVKWMKKEGFYKRWLIPQLGLNAFTVYANRPVGNRPEFMPLDNSLNADIQFSLSLHCAITAYLDDNDERKFSMRTPLTIVEGIRRIYGNEGNVPSSKRIIQDCDLALRAFGVVYEHGGRMVPSLASRNGHRDYAAGRNTIGWGGFRIKNLLVEEVGRWLHKHALEAKSERTKECLEALAQTDFSDDSISDSDGIIE